MLVLIELTIFKVVMINVIVMGNIPFVIVKILKTPQSPPLLAPAIYNGDFNIVVI
jgi:hypothetical protein